MKEILNYRIEEEFGNKLGIVGKAAVKTVYPFRFAALQWMNCFPNRKMYLHILWKLMSIS